MNLLLVRLLLISCVCLMCLALSAMLLLRDRRLSRERTARIDRVVEPYRPSRAQAGLRLGLGLRQADASFADQALGLLRYDTLRPAIYVGRPLVVVPLAVAVGLGDAGLATHFMGPVGWLLAAPSAVIICRKFFGWCEDRYLSTLYNQFPDALAMIVRAVRVGLPVVEAIRVVARESADPTAREFAGLVSQTAIGVPLDDALREMAERNRLPEYRFFATALSLQSQTGGGLTETLENLADTIRKRVQAKIRGHALAAEARMSSYILGGLPLVTGGLLSLMNPDYMSVLFTDPSGQKLLLVGGGLLGTGAFTMRAMIRKSLS